MQYQLFSETKDAWEAILESIEHAERSIDIEQFIFINNEIGLRFLNKLKEKSKSGIKVRLLIDAVGSFFLYTSNIQKELEEAGVAIEFFNDIIPWYPKNVSLWYFRDHRKVVIIDEKISYIGGFCISDEMKDWRDTTIRIEGEIVEFVNAKFNEMWLIQQKPKKRLRARLNIKKEKINIEDQFSYTNNSPLPGKRYLYNTLVKLINESKNEILINSPYFLPDRKVLASLGKATRRGVKVKIIIPRHSDHKTIDAGFQTYVTELFEKKIEIYYFENRMMHAKTLIFDRKYSMIGSLNMDNVSLWYNFESSLLSSDEGLALDLLRIWDKDLMNSTKLTWSDFINRPLIDKLLSFLIYPFRKLL